MNKIKKFFVDWHRMEVYDAELLLKCFEKFGYWRGMWNYMQLHVYTDLVLLGVIKPSKI